MPFLLYKKAGGVCRHAIARRRRFLSRHSNSSARCRRPTHAPEVRRGYDHNGRSFKLHELYSLQWHQLIKASIGQWERLAPGEKASASIHNGDITIQQQIVASSAGALLTSLVVTPMDVVKIRLQSQVRPLAEGECFLFSNGLMDHLCRVCGNRAAGLGGAEPCEWFNRPGHFSGTLDAFIKIAHIEGPRSLWSGLAPTMLSAIPATVFYFTLYDNLLYRLRDALNSGGGGGTNHCNGGLLISAAPLFAGTAARTVAVSVVSPLELIRTKMQSERLSYGEMRAAIVRTVQFDGYSALWRGWTATIMRDIPFSAIYWSLYEYGKKRVLHIAQRQKTNFALSFACGALSGSVAALLTLPFDVAKTHQQITLGHVNAALAADKRHGPGKAKVAPTVFSVMRELVKNKGLSALFTGVVPRVARVAPACAVMIGSYEELKLFFARKNRDFGGNCSR
uniref:Mitochondrial carrier protein n=1 Tax=Globodera rostochiensis TaxID=31243 RepID=A0A914HRB8_GLORO